MSTTVSPALSSSVHAAQNHLPVEQATAHAAESVARPHGYSSDNEVAIHDRLSTFFASHINGDNHEEIAALIKNRTQRLHEMGETPASIEALLTKASRSDHKTLAAESAKKALPYAVDLLFKKPSSLTSLLKGEGPAAALLHHTAHEALQRNYFLQARPEELVPVMAEATQGRRDSASAAKNIARMAFDVAREHPDVQHTLANVGKRIGQTAIMTRTPQGMAAGAAILGGIGLAAGASHMLKKSTHQSGPEFLFAKENWEQEVMRLKGTQPASETRPAEQASAHTPSPGFNEPAASLRGQIRDIMKSMVFSHISNLLNNFSVNSESGKAMKSDLNALRKMISPTLDEPLEPYVQEAMQHIANQTSAPESKATHFAQQAQLRLG